jgi:hypothetical protein
VCPARPKRAPGATKHRLLTTNNEPKSPSRRAGDQSNEKIVIVRGALNGGAFKSSACYATSTSPVLQAAPATNIAASGPQGGPFSPSSFSYTLSASSGSINYSISGVPSWLTSSATSGTASSGTTVTFTVNANANGLAANTYNATITFTNSGTGGTQTRTASLIAASGPQGGPFSPSSFSYTLSPSSGSANYSITNVPSWLTASSTSSNSHFGWEHCVDGGATD